MNAQYGNIPETAFAGRGVGIRGGGKGSGIGWYVGAHVNVLEWSGDTIKWQW